MDNQFKNDIEKAKDNFKEKIRMRKEYLQGLKDEIRDLQQQITRTNNELDSLDKTMKQIDGKAVKIWEERQWLKDNGYARLDGRVAKAIDARKLNTVVKMKSRPTVIQEYETFVADGNQYWCAEWFAEVIKHIPHNKRQKMYETLAELQHNHEELQCQIGMWLLEGENGD